MYYKIYGGSKLKGRVTVTASKNALLPILACCLMIKGEVVLERCPRLLDVENMLKIIRRTGGVARFEGENLVVDCTNSQPVPICEELTCPIRSSIFILGPLLSRFSKAQVCYPGGCSIGLRPIDLHLYGLRTLGAKIIEENGEINCDGTLMANCSVFLDFPSVGATENIMMASVLKRGRTVISNCAREPEICDLANFINVMGGKVYGAGTDKIVIDGVKRLFGGNYSPLKDRIVAGTYMIASAITGGDVEIEGANCRHLHSLCEKLTIAGVKIINTQRGIRVCAPKRIKSVRKIETQPYPGFPTDLQPQITALLSTAQGTSVVVENLFENRFNFTSELLKMGADVTVKDRVAIIKGNAQLNPSIVEAQDLRGGASLVLAALCAEGESIVKNVHHIDRGYCDLALDLQKIGAKIERVSNRLV